MAETISSFYFTANGDRDITSYDYVDVVFEAYYYDNGQKKVIARETKEQIVVPANDRNLYWFKWTVPGGTEGKTVYVTFSVNNGRTVEERSYSNNDMTESFTVKAKTTGSQTSTPAFLSSPPGTYTNTQAPAATSGSLTWSQYTYENGRFVNHTYGFKVDNAGLVIAPDSTAEGKKVNGVWKMKSGYGITATYNLKLKQVSGTELPGSDAYAVGKATALFPEFNYQADTGKCSVMEQVNGSSVFVKNNAMTDKRIHLTPVWFPNGAYMIAVKVEDIMTPVGKVSAVVHSNLITIDGSLFDDWYLGK